MAMKMAKGQFDMNDLRMQLKQMQSMGGLGMLAGMMPGMKKAKAAMQQSGMDDKVLVHMDAIIGSSVKTNPLSVQSSPAASVATCRQNRTAGRLASWKAISQRPGKAARTCAASRRPISRAGTRNAGSSRK